MGRNSLVTLPALLASVAILAASSAALAAGAAGGPATKPAAVLKDRPTLEADFAALLTGAKLVGFYAGGKDAEPKKDEYTIIRAVKGNGNEFVITTQVKYQGATREVDFKMPVEWAGDTPVISLTDYTVPGYGTFTVRILFYAEKYAGTWAHGNHGGLMWGNIEKTKAEK